MSRYIDAEDAFNLLADAPQAIVPKAIWKVGIRSILDQCNAIDIVRCEKCRKSHIDGKTTHHLWCTEWGRSTDPFGYCERGEREDE